MATAAELFAQLNTDSNSSHFVISEDLRTITIPDGQEVIGVYSDENVRRIWFDAPIECDGTSLTDFQISINYRNALGDTGRHFVTDATTLDNKLIFSWLVGRAVFAAKGEIYFSVCMRKFGADQVTILNEFNTTITKMLVLDGIEADVEIPDPQQDLINSIITNTLDAAAEAREAAQEADEARINIANIHAPDLLAGAAESLTGHNPQESAWKRRISEQDGTAQITQIQGDTISWNQLGKEMTIDNYESYNTSYASCSCSGGVATLTVLQQSSGNYQRMLRTSYTIDKIPGHKMLFVVDVMPSKTLEKLQYYLYRSPGSTQSSTVATNVAAGVWTRIAKFEQITIEGVMRIGFSIFDANFVAGDWLQYKNWQMFDLTQIFGVGNEPSTIEEFNASFPFDYYAYDPGSLLPVNIAGIQSTDAQGNILQFREIDVSTYFSDGLKSVGVSSVVRDILTPTSATKHIGSTVITADQWTEYSTGTGLYYKSISGAKVQYSATLDRVASDKYPTYGDTSQPDNTVRCGGSNNRVYLKVPEGQAPPEELHIYYQLATPVVVSIDAPLNMSYRTKQGGVEQFVAPEGLASATPVVTASYGYTAESLIETVRADIPAMDVVQPNLISGAAETLMNNEGHAETFATKVSSSNSIAQIQSLLGNTVIWSQLNAAQTFNRTTTGSLAYTAGTKVIAGHKYYHHFEVVIEGTPTSTPSFASYTRENNSNHYTFSRTLPLEEGTYYISGLSTNNYDGESIGTAGNVNGNIWKYINVGGASNIIINNFVLIDLTLIFGAGNEPTAAAEFEALFPEAYYSYDTGSLLPVNITGIESAGLVREIPMSMYFPDGMHGMNNGLDAHDELTPTKAIKRFNIVDMGTLDWTLHSSGKFRVAKRDCKSATREIPANIKCIPYTSVPSQTTEGDMFISKWFSSIDGFEVKDSRYDNADDFRAAMNGVMCVYELKTYEETPIDSPLNLTYRTEVDGAESIVVSEGSNSSAPTMILAYSYTAEQLRNESQSLIAPIEYGTASINYAEGSYLIMSGTLYRVIIAIASGETIIPDENVLATTVMQEIGQGGGGSAYITQNLTTGALYIS